MKEGEAGFGTSLKKLKCFFLFAKPHSISNVEISGFLEPGLVRLLFGQDVVGSILAAANLFFIRTC